ncbi:MAG: hypothetical protein JJU23_08325, partial [Cyclobacteriaceae bacterium]|nr:hypothetical protein [Cyclobacteriaceae bacterium]
MKYLYLTILLGLYFTAPAQNTSDSTEIEPTYFKLRGFSFGLTSQSAWNNDISNYDVYNPAAYELASVFTNTDTRSYPGLNFELFFEMRPSVGLNTIFNLYLGSYGQTVNSNLYSPHFYGYRFGHFQFSPTIYRNIALSNKLILQVKGGLSFNFHRFYSFVLGVPMVGSLPGGFSDSDFNKNSSSLRVLPAFGTSLL